MPKNLREWVERQARAAIARVRRLPGASSTAVYDIYFGDGRRSRGRLCGVVDLVNACRGPRGCGVAHCRTSLIALAGQQAADNFLTAYEGLTGERYDLYWDLVVLGSASIIEHSPEHWTPE